MAKWRPTRAQFWALGLPAESCTAPARPVTTVFTAEDAFELAGHGFADGDAVRFIATGDVAGDPPALPAPLSGAVLYEAAPLSGDLFQVRGIGGGVVDLTDEGTGVISVVADVLVKLDVLLEHAARWVDDHATPYHPPDGTPPAGWPPESFIRCACKIAALDFAVNVRAASPTYSIDDVRKEAEAAQIWLDKLRSGKPLAVQPTDATPTVAEMGPKARSRAPRGFRRDRL